MLHTILRTDKLGTVGTACATANGGYGCDNSSGCEDLSEEIESSNRAGFDVYDDERVFTPGALGSVQPTGVSQLG